MSHLTLREWRTLSGEDRAAFVPKDSRCTDCLGFGYSERAGRWGMLKFKCEDCSGTGLAPRARCYVCGELGEALESYGPDVFYRECSDCGEVICEDCRDSETPDQSYCKPCSEAISLRMKLKNDREDRERAEKYERRAMRATWSEGES